MNGAHGLVMSSFSSDYDGGNFAIRYAITSLELIISKAHHLPSSQEYRVVFRGDAEVS